MSISYLKIPILLGLFVVTHACGSKKNDLKNKDDDQIQSSNNDSGIASKELSEVLLSRQENSVSYLNDGLNRYFIHAIETQSPVANDKILLSITAGIYGRFGIPLSIGFTKHGDPLDLYIKKDPEKRMPFETTVYFRLQDESIEVGSMIMGDYIGRQLVSSPDMSTLRLCEDDYENNCQLSLTISSNKSFRDFTEENFYSWDGFSHDFVNVEFALKIGNKSIREDISLGKN